MNFVDPRAATKTEINISSNAATLVTRSSSEIVFRFESTIEQRMNAQRRRLGGFGAQLDSFDQNADSEKYKAPARWLLNMIAALAS